MKINDEIGKLWPLLGGDKNIIATNSTPKSYQSTQTEQR